MNFLDILKQFNRWIDEGNAHQISDNLWLEQSTQYKKKFTKQGLLNFFYKEYINC